MATQATYTVLANGQPAADCPFCGRRHPYQKGTEGTEVVALCSHKEERTYVLTEEREICETDRRRA